MSNQDFVSLRIGARLTLRS